MKVNHNFCIRRKIRREIKNFFIDRGNLFPGSIFLFLSDIVQKISS